VGEPKSKVTTVAIASTAEAQTVVTP
jgi:hypothetical protein